MHHGEFLLAGLVGNRKSGVLSALLLCFSDDGMNGTAKRLLLLLLLDDENLGLAERALPHVFAYCTQRMAR